jgi:hypothetical protein
LPRIGHVNVTRTQCRERRSRHSSRKHQTFSVNVLLNLNSGFCHKQMRRLH